MPEHWWNRPEVFEFCATHQFCQVCGAPACNTPPHHRFPKCRARDFKGNIHRKSNLARACERCHSRFHSRLGQPSPRKIDALIPEARRLLEMNPNFAALMPQCLVKALKGSK